MHKHYVKLIKEYVICLYIHLSFKSNLTKNLGILFQHYEIN